MRRFVFIIGSMDDFKDAEALKEAHQENDLVGKNFSIFSVALRADCGTDSLTIRDIATYIGRGLAFSNGWCMDDTVSILIDSQTHLVEEVWYN